jgi:fido (protein-threonine AMPylation protein)
MKPSDSSGQLSQEKRDTLLCDPSQKRALELHNQTETIRYVTAFHEQYPDRNPFRIGVLQGLHRMTIEGIYPCAGNYRSHLTTAVSVVGAHFSPSASGDVQSDLIALLEDASEHCGPEPWPFTGYEAMLRRNLDATLLAARPFHRFMEVHPFQGGNGRVGRAFLHLALYQMELLTPPMQIFDYMESRKGLYIECLQIADRGNIRPLQDYLFRGIVEAAFMPRLAAPGPGLDALSGRLDKQMLTFVLDPQRRAKYADRSFLKRLFSLGRELDRFSAWLARTAP